MWRWIIPIGVAFAGTIIVAYLYVVVKDESLARTYALVSVVIVAFAVFQSLRARR